jgi:hypothetical protein
MRSFGTSVSGKKVMAYAHPIYMANTVVMQHYIYFKPKSTNLGKLM